MFSEEYRELCEEFPACFPESPQEREDLRAHLCDVMDRDLGEGGLRYVRTLWHLGESWDDLRRQRGEIELAVAEVFGPKATPA